MSLRTDIVKGTSETGLAERQKDETDNYARNETET